MLRRKHTLFFLAVALGGCTATGTDELSTGADELRTKAGTGEFPCIDTDGDGSCHRPVAGRGGDVDITSELQAAMANATADWARYEAPEGSAIVLDGPVIGSLGSALDFSTQIDKATGKKVRRPVGVSIIASYGTVRVATSIHRVRGFEIQAKNITVAAGMTIAGQELDSGSDGDGAVALIGEESIALEEGAQIRSITKNAQLGDIFLVAPSISLAPNSVLHARQGGIELRGKTLNAQSISATACSMEIKVDGKISIEHSSIRSSMTLGTSWYEYTDLNFTSNEVSNEGCGDKLYFHVIRGGGLKKAVVNKRTVIAPDAQWANINLDGSMFRSDRSGGLVVVGNAAKPESLGNFTIENAIGCRRQVDSLRVDPAVTAYYGYPATGYLCNSPFPVPFLQ